MLKSRGKRFFYKEKQRKKILKIKTFLDNLLMNIYNEKSRGYQRKILILNKTLKRTVGYPEWLQREMSWLETSYRKIIEDYLGVALIKPGDSVIVKMRGFVLKAIRVEPYNTSSFMET